VTVSDQTDANSVNGVEIARGPALNGGRKALVKVFGDAGRGTAKAELSAPVIAAAHDTFLPSLIGKLQQFDRSGT
jgi:hypothetical protein